MAQSHRLRIGRWSVPGQVYLITAVCWQRHTVFAEFLSAREVVNALRDVEPSASTPCFVVMPDHLHWLMKLEPQAELSATVRLVKKPDNEAYSYSVGRDCTDMATRLLRQANASRGGPGSNGTIRSGESGARGLGSFGARVQLLGCGMGLSIDFTGAVHLWEPGLRANLAV
jgi:hypothetical protein